MRVRVYRNLNKGGLSIKSKIDGKWKVSDYSNHAILENCTFRTSDKERERIVAGGNRSVHAWIEGDLISLDASDYDRVDHPVPYYSPYKTARFEIDGNPVDSVSACKVYAPSKGD